MTWESSVMVKNRCFPTAARRAASAARGGRGSSRASLARGRRMASGGERRARHARRSKIAADSTSRARAVAAAYHPHDRPHPGRPPWPNRTVFFVSDGTGITAETFGNSILAQFAIKPRHVRRPFIDTPDKAHQVVREINHTAAGRGQAADRLHHPGQPRDPGDRQGAVATAWCSTCSTPSSSRSRPSSASSRTTASAASPTSPKSQEYNDRIEAINFSLAHDDGQSAQEPGGGRRDPGRREPQRQDADLALPGDAARHQGGQLPADPGGLRARQAARRRWRRTRPSASA